MLVLDSLGSDFEVEYKGETYKIEYVFPTALHAKKYMEVKEIEGQRHLVSDLHKQFSTLVTNIEGLELSIGEKADQVKIDTASKLYKYPLYELQATLAVELDNDLKKKYTLTTKE